MTYAPKHAKPTSLLVAVLGGRHSDTGSTTGSAADGGTADGTASDTSLAALTVPAPRSAADEHMPPREPEAREPESREPQPAGSQADEASETTRLRADPRQHERDVVFPVRAEALRNGGTGRLK